MFVRNRNGRLADLTLCLLLLAICFAALYPLWYVLMYSLSDSVATTAKPVTFLPLSPTLKNFRAVFASPNITSAFAVSVGRTVLGTFGGLTVTTLAAYAISNKLLVGRRIFLVMFIIPMYFSGGLLPQYVVINKLGLADNVLVYILPMLFSGFNFLLLKVFFEQLSPSLHEAALIDGASPFQIFTRVVLPSSKPVLATVGLYIGVAQWNAWFDAFLYINKVTLFPLQALLQKIILDSQVNDISDIMTKINNMGSVTPEAIKMATVIVATVPILLVYPFLQKYFVKGMMIGAVKE